MQEAIPPSQPSEASQVRTSGGAGRQSANTPPRVVNQKMIRITKAIILVIFFSACAGILYWKATQKTDLQILSEIGIKEEIRSIYRQSAADEIAEKSKNKIKQERINGLYLDEKEAKARLAIERVKLWADVYLYGTGGLLASVCVAVLVLAGGYTFAHVRRAGIVIYKIGKHSEVPVRIKDMSAISAEGVAVLTQSEFMRAKAPEEYLKLCIAMAEKAALRSHVAAQMALPAPAGSEVIDVPRPVPTFAELYARGEFQQGADLLIGFDEHGQPQRRSVTDIKAMSVAGWQGGGKTVSTGYLVACALLQYPGAVAHVIDPHSENKEGLGHLLRPLEKTGRVQVIGNFDLKAGVPKLIKSLNDTLDARLTGRDKSNSLILLVVDELARLAKLDFFDVLVSFLERCTEETRKAGIVFIGSSQKWAARSFKGRADIRACMPSMLMHKAKKSQAKFLMEDATPQEYQLLKKIKNPGTALLSTSCQTDPILVNIPFIVQNDIVQVAETLKEANGGFRQCEKNLHVDDIQKKQTLHIVSAPVSSEVSESETPQGENSLNNETPTENTRTPAHTKTQALVCGLMEKRGISRKQIAEVCEVSLAMVDHYRNGLRKLTTEKKAKLLAAFPEETSAEQNRKVIQLFEGVSK